MPYCVRRMCQEDVAQVSEIDREAFPTQLPPPNYRHELQKRLAHYFVAYDQEKTIELPDVKDFQEKSPASLIPGWRKLFGRHQSSSNGMPLSRSNYIVGFIGFWILAEEAHISSIAVRESYRQRGIGELLLISAINLATKLKARIITLEVRASNNAAQSLYAKYGFTQVGIRRGYYIDDREDALIMTTGDIKSTAFRTLFQKQEKAHSRKWETAHR